jgi:hypothetical protein
MSSANHGEGNGTMGSDFTVADVLAWARTKPADEAYDYTRSDNCAICQFLRETGRAARPLVDMTGWEDATKPYQNVKYPDEIAAAAIGRGELRGDNRAVLWTFGALVKRLEALCPETPVTGSNWGAIDAYLTDDLVREEQSA